MKVYLKTVKGIYKSASEDRVLVGTTVFQEQAAEKDINIGCVVVADGVGGNRGGAVAAQQVCKALAELAEPTAEDFSRINQTLNEMGHQEEKLRDMATTASGICFKPGGGAYAFHVGNTRIYSLQAGEYLRQLTDDDTVVNYLVKTGKLTEEEAEAYPARNEITACFGGGKATLLKVKTFYVDLDSNNLFLITCDGIHESLSIDAMEDCIAASAGDWAKAVEGLITAAQQCGSTDDCTAVIIECTGEEKQNGLEISQECVNLAGSPD